MPRPLCCDYILPLHSSHQLWVFAIPPVILTDLVIFSDFLIWPVPASLTILYTLHPITCLVLTMGLLYAPLPSFWKALSTHLHVTGFFLSFSLSSVVTVERGQPWPPSSCWILSIIIVCHPLFIPFRAPITDTIPFIFTASSSLRAEVFAPFANIRLGPNTCLVHRKYAIDAIV